MTDEVRGGGGQRPVPCWARTLLADGSPESFAEELSATLETHRFETATSKGSPAEYGDYDTDNSPQYLESIGWATSWVRLDGSSTDGIIVRARVADRNTRSSCVSEDNVLIEADLSTSDVVAVIHFADRSSSSR